MQCSYQNVFKCKPTLGITAIMHQAFIELARSLDATRHSDNLDKIRKDVLMYIYLDAHYCLP